MSLSVQTTVVEPGEDDYLDEAWALKETIRRSQGVLKQRRRFFDTAYRQARTFVIRTADDTALIGFASTRDGGYLLFLAVSPEFQDEGFGRELVGAVASEYSVITCHARVSNESALEFYDTLGFEIVRRVPNYYEDGEDAYFLRLGERSSVGTKLARLFSI